MIPTNYDDDTPDDGEYRIESIDDDHFHVLTPEGEQHVYGPDTGREFTRITIGPEACKAFFGGHKWNSSHEMGHVTGFGLTTRRCRLCGLSQVKSTEWENME